MNTPKKTKTKPIKKFRVDLDLKYSYDFIISARSTTDAKKIAFEKLIKALKQKDFNIYADLD